MILQLNFLGYDLEKIKLDQSERSVCIKNIICIFGKKKKINEYKIKCIGIKKKIYQNVYELCVKLK